MSCRPGAFLRCGDDKATEHETLVPAGTVRGGPGSPSPLHVFRRRLCRDLSPRDRGSKPDTHPLGPAETVLPVVLSRCFSGLPARSLVKRLLCQKPVEPVDASTLCTSCSRHWICRAD